MREVRSRSVLCRTSLPGLHYSLNPYRGCQHGCLYCYSPAVLRETRPWGRFVDVKINAPEVLREELEGKPRKTVGVGTVTDPYQPLEARFRLTRECLRVLRECGFPICVQTKSDLILRDIDLLCGGSCEVGVTITTMDEGIARALEPGASPPGRRARVLEEFSSRGVSTWLFLGPLLPSLTDSEDGIGKVVEVAASTGSLVIYDKLNLKRGVMERLRETLEELCPETLRILLSPSLRSKAWKEERERVERMCREKGVRCEPAFSS
ncbi:MAG: radical SAM protein [Candidatus Hadarchaeales archaeon]